MGPELCDFWVPPPETSRVYVGSMDGKIYRLRLCIYPEWIFLGMYGDVFLGSFSLHSFRVCLRFLPPRGLGMLDVAFDLIFEQHLLGLDDKLGAKIHGSLGPVHRSLWFCVPRFIEVPRFIKVDEVDCFRCKCC